MNDNFEYVVWVAVAIGLAFFWLRLRRAGR